uniref:Sodium channel protein Nach n=1 Tax=Anopheles farauti TaxID=69004 RepID=A0A182QY66_9DIPT
MSLLLRTGRAFYRILVDYCHSSSLAGIGYVVNRRYHWIERLFWLVCLLVAWFFAVQLILAYMNLFRTDVISIAVENVNTRVDPVVFPAVGVCEMGYAKQTYTKMEQFMETLRETEDMEYNYDVEDYIMRVTFHNLYNMGSVTSYCEMQEHCDECMKCPKDGYYNMAMYIRANCSQLFHQCQWNGQPFDCCRYFVPLATTEGTCFLLNSIQTVEKHGDRWLRLEMNSENPDGDLLLMYNYAASTHILNEDDIPHILLNRLRFNQIYPGYEEKVYFTLQNIVNDPLVRAVHIAVRRCLFPDEVHLSDRNTEYRKYSYSVCATECLKAIQIKACNCFHLNFQPTGSGNTTACDYTGMQCLDNNNLIAPATKLLLPWHSEGISCHCYPSCTENEIRVIGRHSYDNDRHERSIKLKLMIHPTQRYRRQIVRENLDVVVSIGGILGLFTGASILSIVEFFYFFTVRFISYAALGEVSEMESDDSESSSQHEHDEQDEYYEIS